MQINATISRDNGIHKIHLEQPDNQFVSREFSAELKETSELNVNGKIETLKSLWQKLIDYEDIELEENFNERGQLEIGRYLCGQILKGLEKEERRNLFKQTVDLRIITDDEMTARLPWTLIYDDRRFLAATGWTVSLSLPQDQREDLELTPSPKIMVVMPQPNDWSPTSAESHIEDLERTLSSINSLHFRGKNLHVVETWEEFKTQLPIIKPHILYYYGHGTGDAVNSKLIFAERLTKNEVEVSAAEFANVIRSLGKNAPLMAYINCCSGDVGGLLGVGRQLGGFIRSVITNCTKAEAKTAQLQALDIWKSILCDGLTPHSAVTAMRRHLGGQAGKLSDVRWLTPVMHCGYNSWTFKPPKTPGGSLPLNWESTLDRVHQTGTVLYHTGTMLLENKLRTLVFLWYGEDGQGVEPFYKRLEFELQNRHRDVGLYQVRPEFPQEFVNYDQSVKDMLAEAFNVHSFDEVTDKIRIKAREIGKRQTIVYIRFPVIKKGMAFYEHINYLKDFLEWMEKNFVGRFDEHTFVLVGFAYVVKDTLKFKDVIDERIRVEEYDDLAFYDLAELSQINNRDLFEFLRMHKIWLPKDERKEVIDKIMSESGGDYEKALEFLKFYIEGKQNQKPQSDESGDDPGF